MAATRLFRTGRDEMALQHSTTIKLRWVMRNILICSSHANKVALIDTIRQHPCILQKYEGRDILVQSADRRVIASTG